MDKWKLAKRAGALTQSQGLCVCVTLPTLGQDEPIFWIVQCLVGPPLSLLTRPIAPKNSSLWVQLA